MTPGADLAMLGSPDPLCLAEACGMLFSPAPAKLAAKAASKVAAVEAGPAAKPGRKLFQDELCCGGKGEKGAAEGPLALDDLPAMPKLEFAH